MPFSGSRDNNEKPFLTGPVKYPGFGREGKGFNGSRRGGLKKQALSQTLDLEGKERDTRRGVLKKKQRAVYIINMEPAAGTNLLVLYGSQTGTAEDVAERVAREGMQLGLKPFVSSMNDFGVPTLASKWMRGDAEARKLVVFIAATTGQGDPPDNMRDFWRNLCKAQYGPTFLQEMLFGVIALGDSSYEKYNFVGKKLFRRLKQLGAVPILDVCLGDDQHDLGYHASVNPWIERVWQHIGEDWNGVLLNSKISEPLSKFCIVDGPGAGDWDDSLSLESDKMPCSLETRMLVGNKRVTADNHWQDTRLISIERIGSKLEFSPGDVLAVQPCNLQENVDKFFQIFPDLMTLTPIYIQKNKKLPWSKISPELLKLMGPQPWDWWKIITYIFDIQSVPRLYFFELMAHFADNELEKEKLLEFCSPQGQEDLFSYCNRPKRNILEVFDDFPNTTRNIPRIFLFDLIPAIKPRSFSIASSPKQFPYEVQILVAVVEYQTKIKAKRKGLCSNWLAHHNDLGSLIPIWVQKGSFGFPSPDENAHVIMIGPGTGVAPFRAVINDNLTSSWKKWLFFGCRNEESDFYFQDEWKELQDKKNLEFRCAVSRDAEGQKLDYVQDVLLKESKAIMQILCSHNFYIYIAGSAKQMPKDVYQTFIELLKLSGNPNPQAFLDHSRRLGRYQTETWS